MYGRINKNLTYIRETNNLITAGKSRNPVTCDSDGQLFPKTFKVSYKDTHTHHLGGA